MAERTKVQLLKEVNDNVTSNGMRDITGKKIRDLATNLVDSVALETDVDDTIPLDLVVSPGHIDKTNIPNRFVVEIRYRLNRFDGNARATANVTQLQVQFGSILNARTINFKTSQLGTYNFVVPVTSAMIDEINDAAVGSDLIFAVTMLNSDGVQVLKKDGSATETRSQVALSLEVIESESGGVSQDEVNQSINTAIENSVQFWARAAPGNEDEHGNQYYPPADALAKDAVQHTVATPNGDGAMVWGLLTEESLAKALATKIDTIAANKARIDQIARHGEASNVRNIPNGGAALDDLVGDHAFQLIDPAAAPDGAVAVVVQVGVTGSDVTEGAAVAIIRNWVANSQRTFTITQSQYDSFSLSIPVDATSVEFRYRFYADGVIDPGDRPGDVSLGAALSTEIALWYVGAHNRTPLTLQEAVEASNSAGVTSITLPENYADWEALHIYGFDTIEAHIYGDQIDTAMLAVQSNQKNVVISGSPGANKNQGEFSWTRSNRTIDLSGADRIIYAQLR